MINENNNDDLYDFNEDDSCKRIKAKRSEQVNKLAYKIRSGISFQINHIHQLKGKEKINPNSPELHNFSIGIAEIYLKEKRTTPGTLADLKNSSFWKYIK